MSETKTVGDTITRESVDTLTSKRHEPDWLKKLRVAAMERYLQTPNPLARQDEWRKTLVETLDLSSLTPLVAGTTDSTKVSGSKHVEKVKQIFPKRAGLIVDTGDASFVEFDEALAAKGIVFTTIANALDKHLELVQKYLESSDETEESKFSLLAKALFAGGAFLYVPPDLDIKEPFVIINGFHKEGAGQAIFPRTILVSDRNSRLDVVNVFTSFGAESKVANKVDSKGKEVSTPPANAKQRSVSWSLSNAVVEIHALDGSRLQYLELTNFADNVFSVVHSTNNVKRDATVYSLSVGLGGGQIKADLYTSLQDRGATAEMMGIVFGDDDEHLSYNTIQNHDAPDTTSHINFRVALKDRAVSAYQGNIKVAKVAQKTDAYQSNKNLLLGSEARADSIPRLEILADDVKCSHGATVGPVDKNQVFYLMTRGLDEKTAEELVVSGFFNTVLETCPVEGARDWIEALISEKIHGPGHAALQLNSKDELI
jgi:FeS assembly protein SufD